MRKKVIFPIVCMLIGIAGSVCECINTINKKELEDVVKDEVAKQLNVVEEESE